MIRGTRVLEGDEARAYTALLARLRALADDYGYDEVVLPALWEQAPFVAQAGPEILGQMWTFQDKGGRDVCLIPEATAVVRELYRERWAKGFPKPVRVCYVTRCYRYEKPQRGRYREFTQFGIECLGGEAPGDADEVRAVLREVLDTALVEYEWSDAVKRGLDYYVEDGFEASCPALGAQKQVAGGGRYDCGIGWAIGVDRLLLARSLEEETHGND